MDNDFNEKINMDELFNEKKQTEQHKIKIYQKILARVHKKIKTTSRMRNSEKFSFFVIPEFVLGIPRYDMVECTSYIIEKLIDNGFQIKYTHPNLLFISWQHYIPKYQRVKIKKKTGISVDSYGNVITKKDENKDKDSLNGLLLKNTPSNKKGILKKKDSKNYTSVSNYKPTGNLIYNTKMIESIENLTEQNKKINFN